MWLDLLYIEHPDPFLSLRTRGGTNVVAWPGGWRFAGWMPPRSWAALVGTWRICWPLRCGRACAGKQGKGMPHAAAAVHVMGKGTRVTILVT